MKNKITISEIYQLLVELKKQIGDEYRADEETDLPSMQVTIGAKWKVWQSDEAGNPIEKEVEWNFQTGDNSFSGSAYFYPHWSVIYLFRNSNCKDLAREAANELNELLQEEAKNKTQ